MVHETGIRSIGALKDMLNYISSPPALYFYIKSSSLCLLGLTSILFQCRSVGGWETFEEMTKHFVLCSGIAVSFDCFVSQYCIR